MKKVIAGVMIAVGMLFQLGAVGNGDFYGVLTTADFIKVFVGLALSGIGLIIIRIEEEKE